MGEPFCGADSAGVKDSTDTGSSASIHLSGGEMLWESTIFDAIEEGVEDSDQFFELMLANCPKFETWVKSHIM